MYSFLATKTDHGIFPFLNGVQGQIIDRTEEYRFAEERGVNPKIRGLERRVR